MRHIYLLFSILLGLTACAPPIDLGHDESANFLKSILPGSKAVTQGKLGAHTITHGDRSIDIYSYTPNSEPQAIAILISGLNKNGANDPRLVNLAKTLTHHNFTVVLVDLPEAKNLHLAPENIEDIKAVFHYVEKELSAENDLPIGIGALSFGTVPGILAALDPDINNNLDFFVSIGGYHDYINLISLYTTGLALRSSSSDLMIATKDLEQRNRWTLALTNIHEIENLEDRERFREYALKRLQRIQPLIKPSLEIQSADAHALLRLVNNTDPQQVIPLINALPEKMRHNIHMLNPAEKDLSGLNAEFIIIHGQNDTVIPASESVDMAEAIGSSQSHLYILSGLEHVNFKALQADVDKLKDAVQRILAHRKLP